MNHSILSASALLLLLLSSCSSNSFIEVPVYHLTRDEFPARGSSIVIVDNSVAQPDKEGGNIHFGDKKTMAISFSKDATSDEYVKWLGEMLDSSGQFANVLLYNTPQRTDESWRSIAPLTTGQLDSIFLNSGVEWILSIDRISSEIKLSEKEFSGFIQAQMETVISPCFSLYNIERNTPDKRYFLSDTLSWVNYGANFVQACDPFLNQGQMIDKYTEAVMWAADKSMKRILPYSESDVRQYITGSAAIMKEAERFMKEDQMQEAAYLWEHAFKSSRRESTRFFSALNLSVYFESINDFDSSLKWIRNARLVSSGGANYGYSVSIDDLERKITNRYKTYQEMKNRGYDEY